MFIVVPRGDEFVYIGGWSFSTWRCKVVIKIPDTFIIVIRGRWFISVGEFSVRTWRHKQSWLRYETCLSLHWGGVHSFSWWLDFHYLQTQTVLIEILHTFITFVAQQRMGESLCMNGSRGSHFGIRDSRFNLCSNVFEGDGLDDVVLVPSPVEYPVRDIVLKRPM